MRAKTFISIIIIVYGIIIINWFVILFIFDSWNALLVN